MGVNLARGRHHLSPAVREIPMKETGKDVHPRSSAATLLNEAMIGRLGTSLEGRPYVVPLSFVYHDGKIFFHSAKTGKKMDHIAGNPRVCFEVDEGELIPADEACSIHWKLRSVIAYGTARVVNDHKEKVEALRLLVEKYGPGKSDQITPERIESYENLAIVEITVEKITEKQDPA